MPTPYSIALVTVPDAKSAETVSMALLERKLAACVNQIPQIRSSYWWEGKIEHAAEILLVIKTRTALMREIVACVKEHHPYSVPEVIGFPISDGLADYLQWLGANTRLDTRASTGRKARA